MTVLFLLIQPPKFTLISFVLRLLLEKLNAVRACMVLGILFIALASVVSFIGTCAKKNYAIIIILFEIIARKFNVLKLTSFELDETFVTNEKAWNGKIHFRKKF